MTKININKLDEFIEEDFEEINNECKEFNINYKREKKKVQEKRAELRKKKKQKNENI